MMELYAIFDSDKGRARYHRMLDEIVESGRKPVMVAQEDAADIYIETLVQTALEVVMDL
jgi:hypothetical protein